MESLEDVKGSVKSKIESVQSLYASPEHQQQAEKSRSKSFIEEELVTIVKAESVKESNNRVSFGV